VAVRQGVRCWVAGVGLGYLLMSMDPYATDRVLTRSETFDIPQKSPRPSSAPWRAELGRGFASKRASVALATRPST
jgi:hypothetical protein